MSYYNHPWNMAQRRNRIDGVIAGHQQDHAMHVMAWRLAKCNEIFMRLDHELALIDNRFFDKWGVPFSIFEKMTKEEKDLVIKGEYARPMLDDEFKKGYTITSQAIPAWEDLEF